MMIMAVGSGEHIGQVLPELGGLLRRPLFTLERVRVCKRDGELLERPHALPGVDERGLPLWQKLMIYTSESAQYAGTPIHRAIVQQLWRRKTPDGATVLRGIWGFHGDIDRMGTSCCHCAGKSPSSPSSSTPRRTSPNLSRWLMKSPAMKV